MATTGIRVNRAQLILRLRDQREQIEQNKIKAATERDRYNKKERINLITRLSKRLSALKKGLADPDRGRHAGYYTPAEAPIVSAKEKAQELTAQIEAAQIPIDRAIRVFEMSPDETITLGPRIISDLGLTNYL